MGIHYMNCQTEISSLDANPALNSGRNRPALASLSKKVLRSSRLACLQPYGACIKTVVHDATFTTADSQTFDSCDPRCCPIVLTNKLLYIRCTFTPFPYRLQSLTSCYFREVTTIESIAKWIWCNTVVPRLIAGQFLEICMPHTVETILDFFHQPWA